MYVSFLFLGPCGCPRPWQRKCACAWAYGHPSGPRQLFFCAQAQNWPRTTAKRLAILVDARKSKRQREGSLSELNPPALEPRDGKKNKLKKSTISRRRCAYGLDAAVERRRAAREPLIPYRLASVFGSSENRREVSRSAPVRDRVRERMDENLLGHFFTRP